VARQLLASRAELGHGDGGSSARDGGRCKQGRADGGRMGAVARRSSGHGARGDGRVWRQGTMEERGVAVGLEKKSGGRNKGLEFCTVHAHHRRFMLNRR